MMTWWLWGLVAALATTPTVSVGQHSLTFSLPVINTDENEQSRRISLSHYVGIQPREPQKALVLYFFSRRSGSDQLDDLSRLQRRYGDQGLQILAISTDLGSVGGLAAWLEEQKLNFPVLRDNHQVVIQRYGFERPPIAIVIDDRGYIFAIGSPGGGDFGADLEAEVSYLISPGD
jgi:peroxiredoxin